MVTESIKSEVVLGGVSTTGTTTFTNQNPTNVVRVVSDTPHSRELVNSSSTGNIDQSISSFLAKPVPVNTGFLTPVNLAGSLLFKFNVASTMLAQPIWADKLRGFMNVRGTAKVRLQINANPFQAGRLLLAYIPQYVDSPDSFSTHLTSLTTISQLPHVEMSLQDAESELIIPYIAPTTHYNLLTGFYDWGTVFCYIYSPLATGTGANQAAYTTWLSFDDFEFEVPIVPQSSFSVRTNKKNIIKKYRVNAIKSNLDSEINEGAGPISSVLSSVSSIAAGLYSIPMLSPIAGPAAWATNLAAGVASSFGWSKPVYDTQPTRVVSTAHAYNANINEPDLVNNLGLIADNKVSIMPDVNLSGVDEMALDFVKRQKAFFTRVTWTTTTLPGPLYSFPVVPAFFANPNSDTLYGVTEVIKSVDYTPIAFLSTLYQYWRGSIEVTIKVVKTEYHTGRLIIAFSPQLAQTTISNSQSNYVHREIVDLRDGYEFVVKVPYCYNSMYMDTEQVLNDIYTMLQVNVLNELVAPDTCAQSVELLIEVRGGTDMEFQIPRRFNASPSLIITPQSGGDQSDLILDNEIGGSIIHDPSRMAAQLCVGESSTSLLQLVKRYSRMRLFSGDFSSANQIGIWPYYFGAMRATGVALSGTAGFLTGDRLGAISACYAHSRGAVRYRMIGDSEFTSPITATGGTICKMVYFDRSANSPFYRQTATPDNISGPSTILTVGGQFNRDNSEPLTYDPPQCYGGAGQIPMYNRTFCRVNRLFFVNTPGVTLASRAPDINKKQLLMSTTRATWTLNTDLYRSASDDFHLSFWLGVPTLGYLASGP